MNCPDAKDLGLDYESLKDTNPMLIYAVCSGFGPMGPQAAKKGFEQVRKAIREAAPDASQEQVQELEAAVSEAAASGVASEGAGVQSLLPDGRRPPRTMSARATTSRPRMRTHPI